jgi:hypothetical protein
MHDMHMKVMIRGLIMDIQFQLILVYIWVELVRGTQDSVPHVLEPGDVGVGEVAEGPDVPPLDQSENMQIEQGFAIPVQVWEDQKSFLDAGRGAAVEDVFLLGATFEDIEDPVKSSIGTLLLHVRAYVFGIDFWRLRDRSEGLLGVLFDVFGCAREDEVYF